MMSTQEHYNDQGIIIGRDGLRLEREPPCVITSIPDAQGRAQAVKLQSRWRDPRRLNYEIDLADVVGHDTWIKKNGEGHWIAKVPGKEDSNPSLHVWAPGHGRHGAEGWTAYDFSRNKGMTVVGYFMDYHGMDLKEAQRHCWSMVGEAPLHVLPKVTMKKNESAFSPELYALQKEAVQSFIQLFTPAERQEAQEMLLLHRKIEPDVYRGLAIPLWIRDGLHSHHLNQRVTDNNLGQLFEKTGLIRTIITQGVIKKRLIWWDNTMVLAIADKKGDMTFCTGRRMQPKPKMDGTPSAKYMNQHSKDGAVTMVIPYGSPLLHDIKDKDLYVLEGVFDAMTLKQFGHQAMALHHRPGADSKNMNDSDLGRWLTRNKEQLQKARNVFFVPDEDEDTISYEIGKRFAQSAGQAAQAMGIAGSYLSIEKLGMYGVKDPNQWLIQHYDG